MFWYRKNTSTGIAGDALSSGHDFQSNRKGKNMSSSLGLIGYLGLGLLGGLLGAKLKIPAGALIGAMLTIIFFKMFMKVHWDIPRSFTFVLQVFLGIMVGASFQPELVQVIKKIAIPVIISCVVLVGTGVILAVVFTRLGLVDIGTAYLGSGERGTAHAGGLFPFHTGRVCNPNGSADFQIGIRPLSHAWPPCEARDKPE
jgi:membrane AbrB-like protein